MIIQGQSPQPLTEGRRLYAPSLGTYREWLQTNVYVHCMAWAKMQFLHHYLRQHKEVKGDTVKIIPVQYKTKAKGIKNVYKKVEVSWMLHPKKKTCPFIWV